MKEFQARVSSEVIFYFEELKKIYSITPYSDLTRSQILTKAFEETSVISNWKPIIDDKHTISLKGLTYESSHGTNIKVPISDEIESGIRALKLNLPFFTDTKSVTIGVTIKYILKGAIILNVTGQLNKSQDITISEEIDNLEKELKDLVAKVNHPQLGSIFKVFKEKITLKK